MSGWIPTHFIDELLTRVDIIDVVDARVPLKKAGRNHTACCPFHNEKTPSFTVSPEKQFYHCFGCGAHGSAINFVMEFDRIEFVDAVEELASSYNMEIPHEVAKGPKKGSDDQWQLLAFANRFFQQNLNDSSKGVQAKRYLQARGLTDRIISEYGLGFAPKGWANLIDFARSNKISADQLEEVGLSVSKEQKAYYDRFRDRIMFPLRDRRGRVIAFGGRVLGDEKPKYINSPETRVFHKGKELYGLYECRQAVRQPESIVVVEGYMDVIALAQYGIRYVVATLGTSTSAEHLEGLFRLVSTVVFCFDGDPAGRQAAWRALEVALPVLTEGRQIRFMFLPEGHDPDSLVRKEAKQGFEARLQQSESLSEFFFRYLSKGVDLSNIDGRSLLANKARPLLEKLPKGVFELLMRQELAQRVGTSPEKLTSLYRRSNNTSSLVAKLKNKTESRSSVRLAIRLLLERPKLALSVDVAGFDGLDMPGLLFLVEMIKHIKEKPNSSCGSILEHWRGTEFGVHLGKLSSQAIVVPIAGIESEFFDTIKNLKKRVAEQNIDQLQKESEQRNLSQKEKSALKKLHDDYALLKS